jgi:hypothetical protein
MSSYAVLWSEPSQHVEAGKLELGPAGLRFEGSCGQCVDYDHIDGVRIGRQPQDRLAGQPTLVLDFAAGNPVRIASLDGAGTLSELAHELARLTR